MTEGRFTRILVATDGSEPALRAEQAAMGLARGCGAKVVLAHVIPPSYYPDEAAPEAIATLEESRRDAAARLLEAARGRWHAAGIEVSTRVLEGDPASELSAQAEGEFDLIVVGKRGRSAVKRWLLGSVSNKIVNGCQAPVLVIS